MKILEMVVVILLIIGGLVWGLLGLFNFNLVEMIFGQLPILVRVIYVLFGVAAVFQIFQWKAIQNCMK